MQQGDILLQVLLRLLQNPLLEVQKVESVRIMDTLVSKPSNKVWEVVRDVLPVENTVNHMTTEQPHLDLVP